MPDSSTSAPRRRRWTWFLVASPVALAFLLVGMVWLAGSETILRFAAAQAPALSAGKLRLDGVHGSLYGPLRVEHLVLDTPEKRFQLNGLHLDWSPRGLLDRQLNVSTLEATELVVTELRPSTKPPALPDSLALPLGLVIPEARLGRLVVRTATGEVALTNIRLALNQATDTYRLDLHQLASPWGSLEGHMALAQDAPFALTGQASYRHPSGQAKIGASGILAKLRLTLDAQLAGGQAQAEAELTPFAPRPLAQVRITGRDLDPAAWQAGLPKAAMNLDARLSSQGKDAYDGTFTLANALAGAWDRERLPLRHATATFQGNLDGLGLDELALDLGQGGHFSGSGKVRADGIHLDLITRDFNPRGLHTRMRAMKLVGSVGLKAAADQQDLVADLAWQRYRLRLDTRLQADTLHIHDALITSGGGSLRLLGQVGLAAPRKMDLAGALEGFDPAAFGNYPAGHVNASFTATGHLLPRPLGSLNFAVADSRFRGQPLSGQGSLNLSETRLWDSDVILGLGPNRLMLKGGFGRSADRLVFDLALPQPQVIHPSLTGRIETRGQVSGSLAQPSGQAEVRARGLAWGTDYRVDDLDGRLRLSQGTAGDMDVTARMTGLRLPTLRLDQASVDARGRRDHHTLVLAARGTEKGLELDLATEWAGGLSGVGLDDLAWSGQVLRLTNRGRHAVTLSEPARLELGRERLLVSHARLSLLGGQAEITELHLTPARLASRGDFQGVRQTELAALLPMPEGMEGNLRLAGEWNLDAGDQVNGRAALWREAGDVSITAEPRLSLGLTALKLSAQVQNSQLRAELVADGATLGRLRARAQTTLVRQDGIWGLAGDTPIQGEADLALGSLAWLNPFLDRRGAISLDGTLQGRIGMAGSLSAPRFDGRARGTGLRLAWPDQGLDLRDGQLEASLEQDVLRLKSLSLRGGDGTLTGQGQLGLKGDQTSLRLELKADRLKLLSRPDRLLVLSGNGSLGLEPGRARLEASLKADQGLLELARDDAPQVSEDVVVLGRPSRTQATGRPTVLGLALELDLGDRFFVKGQGLDAQLGGSVRLQGEGSAPLRANGSIRVKKGAYSAYGQRLEIERGILNFQGPLDNPGLNIIALRKNLAVEAGVSISGTALAPVVRLVSTPVVPDGEKLSWLVLGHGLAESGAQEFDALQVAAGALLGAGESVTLQQRIAHAAGLEEVSLKGAGNLESTVLTLGKRLSSKAYLSYEQGLAGTETLVKIHYALSKRVSVQAQAGTAPAVDLFYTFSFD